MLIYVLDDGETWTLSEPTAVAITPEQLDRIEGGEKFYHVVPDWDERPDPACNCVKCTTERTASRKIVEAQNKLALALSEGLMTAFEAHATKDM